MCLHFFNYFICSPCYYYLIHFGCCSVHFIFVRYLKNYPFRLASKVIYSYSYLLKPISSNGLYMTVIKVVN